MIALATAGAHPDPRVPVGPGDDAAVLTAPDRRVVATCDALVEGRHFRFDLSTAEQVGRRAIAQNAADIAAMGAVCTGFLVALGCPGTTPTPVIEGISAGVAEGVALAGGALIGGDVVRTAQVVITVTALGDLQGRAPVLMSGARAGDRVALRGTLGHSAGGLAALLAGRGDEFADLVGIYRVPVPPLAAGPAAAAAGATALTDVSDGLLRDAEAIAAASGVTVDLDPAALTPDPALAACGSALGLDPWDWVLRGGEDHALLGTFPAGAELPAQWREIGRVRAGAGAVTVGGSTVPGGAGWTSFEAGPDES